MGIMGELFPGKKLIHDGDREGTGDLDRPRVELDLDSGVVRLSPPAPEPRSEPDQAFGPPAT